MQIWNDDSWTRRSCSAFLAVTIAVLGGSIAAQAQTGMGMGGGFGSASFPWPSESLRQPVLYTYENNGVISELSPLHILKHEQRTSLPPGHWKTPPQTRKDESRKTQMAFRTRTHVVHPQPRHWRGGANPSTVGTPFAMQEPNAMKVLDSLETPVDQWVFEDFPLGKLGREIRERFSIASEIDNGSLEDLGIDAETLISGTFTGMSLRAALERILAPMDLAYVVKDETLIITTAEKSWEDLVWAVYGLPSATSIPEIIEAIEATVAPDTWDTVGGAAAIRPMVSAHAVVVSTTHRVHTQVAAFLTEQDAVRCPGNNAPDGEASKPTQRVYPIRDPRVSVELEASLVPMCNAALGADGDPAAKVSRAAECLVIQSASQGFHRYAAEVIRAVDGIKVTTLESFKISP